MLQLAKTFSAVFDPSKRKSASMCFFMYSENFVMFCMDCLDIYLDAIYAKLIAHIPGAR